jgi:hypothetical protein
VNLDSIDGPTGPTGTTGPTGPTGPQGLQGSGGLILYLNRQNGGGSTINQLSNMPNTSAQSMLSIGQSDLYLGIFGKPPLRCHGQIRWNESVRLLSQQLEMRSAGLERDWSRSSRRHFWFQSAPIELRLWLSRIDHPR